MNSSIVTPDPSQLRSISVYTVLQSMNEGSILFGPPCNSSSSWRKFIHTSTQQPGFESAMTVIPAARTTTEGPTVLKPVPLPEDYEARIESFFRFLDDLEAGAY